jgi:hypothetical protein
VIPSGVAPAASLQRSTGRFSAKMPGSGGVRSASAHLRPDPLPSPAGGLQARDGGGLGPGSRHPSKFSMNNAATHSMRRIFYASASRKVALPASDRVHRPISLSAAMSVDFAADKLTLR